MSLPGMGGGRAITPSDTYRCLVKVGHRIQGLRQGGKPVDCQPHYDAILAVHQFFEKEKQARSLHNMQPLEYLRPRELKPEEMQAIAWAQTLNDQGF